MKFRKERVLVTAYNNYSSLSNEELLVNVAVRDPATILLLSLGRVRLGWRGIRRKFKE